MPESLYTRIGRVARETSVVICLVMVAAANSEARVLLAFVVGILACVGVEVWAKTKGGRF